MLTRWSTGNNDFEAMFSAMNQLKTYMDRVWEDAFGDELSNGRELAFFAGTWPRANLIDAGSSLIVVAEVPGLSEQDIKITLNQDVLSISGEREVKAPEGYSVHRQERRSVRFSRSFALPCAVNADKASASVKNGVLSVTLEKAANAMPRQIAIKATS